MSNMVVQTNMLAFNAHRNMGITGNAQARASARLSSGFRINSAADDAAGLAISETMRGQIRSLDQASRNAQDGISLLQVAEGGLATISDMVIRMRELTVQAANDTYTMSDRSMLQLEVLQLVDEILATVDRVEFNTMQLLGTGNGGRGGALSTLHLMIGPNAWNGTLVQGQVVTTAGLQGVGAWSTFAHITTQDAWQALTGLLLGTGLAVSAGHGQNLTAILNAIDEVAMFVNSARANFGAWMNRLEFTIENLDIASENMSAANSRIRDADMALEMMRFTQTNVLQQAAISMLSQANQQPQNLLQLLR